MNSRNANNVSEVMSCHELQNLNHLGNQVTYQTRLKLSKHQKVQQLIHKTHNWSRITKLNNYMTAVIFRKHTVVAATLTGADPHGWL